MAIMDPWKESSKYPELRGRDVNVSDVNTETLLGVAALAPCLLPSEGEQEPIEFKAIHLCPPFFHCTSSDISRYTVYDGFKLANLCLKNISLRFLN